MNIIRFSLLFISLLFLSTSLHAQYRPGSTELGVVLGEPTGISAKFWQSGSTAIDAAAAWSFGKEESLHLHASYLKHKPLEAEAGGLYLFYGIGARALFADDPRFGARIPVGLQYNIESTRLSLFFEVAPTFDLVPETDFGVNGGIGVRYFL
jgi:hypothetical protein